MARFLNMELVGFSFHELLSLLQRRLLAEHDAFYHLVRRSLSILHLALSTEPEERLYLDGASYVITQPEFSRNSHRAHELLKGLEAQAALLDGVRDDLATDGICVRIGEEIEISGLEGCSYLTAPVAMGQDRIGGIGIVGPMRMDYRRMRALVEAMSQCLTEVLKSWEDRAANG